jgi:hypothetical protein
MKLLIHLFVYLILAQCFINAQPIRECGSTKMDEAADQLAKAYQRGPRQQYSSPITIQVYFHILYCDDGTLPAATPENIETEFNDLVSAYAADNICFVNAGFDRIYSTKLDTNFTAGVDASSLFDPYRVANCINIFYTRKIKGNNGSCPGGCGFGGITLDGLPNTFCLVATGNIGYGNTVAHEVGHCFGLLHTFNDGNGFENIDGTNGTTSADRVQDTPADPYDYDTSCNKTGKSCVYSGTCKDPKGQSNFSPPYTNLMSYWTGCYATHTLTTGQYTRAESFINTNAGLKACVAANNVTEGPITINNVRRVISGNNTLTTSGSVLIGGSSVVTYGGGAVILTQGFNALPGNGGNVIIRPKKCN